MGNSQQTISGLGNLLPAAQPRGESPVIRDYSARQAPDTPPAEMTLTLITLTTLVLFSKFNSQVVVNTPVLLSSAYIF